MPKLRFPEFTEEWERQKISNILEIKHGKDYKNEPCQERKYPVMGTGGVITYIDSFLCNWDCVCIGRKGTINKPIYMEKPFWSVDTLFYTKTKGGIPKFQYYLFEKINWLLYNEASGVPSLSAATINNIDVAIPSVNEQKKIVDFLSLIDLKITKQQQIIYALKSYKRGFVFSLFKENNQYNLPTEKVTLSSLLFEYRVRETSGLRVCSVAVNKGVVDQIEHLGRSFSAKDTSKYNQVKNGDIVYTKSPTGDFPFGIIKQNKLNETVAVSPLYGVYTPKSYEVGNLLHYYFEQHQNANNYIKPLAQKGAKNTINITNSNFINGNIIFLKYNTDIKKVSMFLDFIQNRINESEQIYQQLRLVKSHLLQQMFI